MKKVGIAAKIAGIVILVLILLVVGRNWMVQNGESARVFRSGVVPEKLAGFYQGKVNFSTNWQGKDFDATASSGMNIFLENGVNQKHFPFKTYTGRGLQDPNQVLKIDYDLPENPWWVRLIVDEVIETSPGQLLGKIHFKLPIGSWAIGYFRLNK